MTFLDFFKLVRYYLKTLVAILLVCCIVSAVVVLVIPATYTAKAVLLTSGDVALASGFAKSEATFFSKDGVIVDTTPQAAYRTVNIEASGRDYGAVISAANATVAAAAQDCREANNSVSVTANEATYAEVTSLSLPKAMLIALCAGLFIALCFILLKNMIKTPIKSKNDIEAASGLSVIGTIPNHDRGERLLANIRFLTEESPKTIAVIPTGLTGASLTCAELAMAFENSGFAVSRIQGNAHAQNIGTIATSGVVSVIECPPLSEGVGAVYIAREADITILSACEWVDSCKALESIVEELRFAKANIGGVVFLAGKYGSKGLV